MRYLKVGRVLSVGSVRKNEARVIHVLSMYALWVISEVRARERGQSYSRVKHVRFMGNQWGQSTRTKPELLRCMGCMLESDIINVIFK